MRKAWSGWDAPVPVGQVDPATGTSLYNDGRCLRFFSSDSKNGKPEDLLLYFPYEACSKGWFHQAVHRKETAWTVSSIL